MSSRNSATLNDTLWLIWFEEIVAHVVPADVSCTLPLELKIPAGSELAVHVAHHAPEEIVPVVPRIAGALSVIEPGFAPVVIFRANEHVCVPGISGWERSMTVYVMLPEHSFVNE